MRGFFRLTFGATLLGLWASALGQNAGIRISAYPAVSVADERSTVTVTAELRDLAGHPLPDGTQIYFSTTLGSFRDAVVSSTGGTAIGVLVAGGLPGTARITVSAPAYNAVATADFEFLRDRSLLSSATEYIEVVSPSYLAMNFEKKILGAAEPNQGAHLRFRDIAIDADDLQLDAQTCEVKARRAHLRFGQVDQDFEELDFKLTSRQGIGTTTYNAQVPRLLPSGRLFHVVYESKERFGVVQVRSNGLNPSQSALPRDQFAFVDISDAQSLISAKRAVVFPHRDVQFQKAEILVNGQKALRFPLFDVNLNGTTPILTDQVVNLNDSKVSINYPEYVILKPGLSSLFRFRTGETYGRGVEATGGAFLDWETNWNRGDQMDGGLTVSGIARKDYTIALRQSYRPDNRTNSFLQLQTPAFGSVYGALGFTRQFKGFQMDLNANSNRSLSGAQFNSHQAVLNVERDPVRITKLPIQTYFGFTASENGTEADTFSTSQSGIGLRMRNQLLPQAIDKKTLFNATLTVSKLAGTGQPSGLGFVGSAYLARQLSNFASTQMIYDYVDDGSGSSIMGHHRLTLMGSYSGARTNINLLATRTLDADSYNYQADLGYRISGLWRVAYHHTFNQFFGSSLLDYSAMITYRFANRDFGITWSNTTRRIGIQLLGATLN